MKRSWEESSVWFRGDRAIERGSERVSKKESERESEIKKRRCSKHRHTHRQTDGQTHRQTDTQTETLLEQISKWTHLRCIRAHTSQICKPASAHTYDNSEDHGLKCKPGRTL